MSSQAKLRLAWSKHFWVSAVSTYGVWALVRASLRLGLGTERAVIKLRSIGPISVWGFMRMGFGPKDSEGRWGGFLVDGNLKNFGLELPFAVIFLRAVVRAPPPREPQRVV